MKRLGSSGVAVIVLWGSLSSSFAQGQPSDSTADKAVATEPLVFIGDTPFYSWDDYKNSEQFKSEVVRCGTVPDPSKAVQVPEGGPQDCTFSSTNPSSDYDPAVVHYRIPVVVHVIRQSSGITGDVSEAMVQSQIDILNEDFLAVAGTNGANGTDVQIEFYLATEDPNGQPTNGITYSNNSTWYFDGGSYWNTLAWDTNRYLNIYTNSADGALGYVPTLPQGGIVGSNSDRVVILWSSFGRNGPIGPPYDQGRTATHEVGHYLGLEHTFNGGCASPSGCYNNGDLICDTNPEASPASGCFDSGSCSSPNPIDNYMDYSDDLCMEQFTPEQARRMRCSLQYYRPNLFEIGGSLSCGNDVRENFEECDGVDDAACPGLCQTDCTCPQICYLATAPVLSAATPDAGFGATNRYLAISSQDVGISTALRVDGGGWTAWVGEPVEVTENSGLTDPNADPGAKTFFVASLECDPVFLDWSAYGTVYVSHEAIVPNSSYTIESIRRYCDTAAPGDYSPPLEISTAVWGDVSGPYDAGTLSWTAPDGSVGVPSDILGILDKFRNVNYAPIKARADIEPATPDQIINISDITLALNAFKGAPYPFAAGPAPCP